MNYRDHILRAIDFIEANLTHDIDLSACAKACGYSNYHFARIFKEVTKMTPASYIQKRRLSEIAKGICRENCSIADLAFRYGYNSKENFTRAFKNEHHILPTEYKSAANSLHLCERFYLDAEPFQVTPQLLVLEGFTLIAYPCDEEHAPNFWNKYNARKWSKRLSGGKSVPDYGVSLWHGGENRLDYFVGIRAQEAMGDLSGTVCLRVKGGLYAAFDTPPASHGDFVNTIHRTWAFIFGKWLPQSGYARTGGYEFETYLEEGRTFSERIFIPIKEA